MHDYRSSPPSTHPPLTPFHWHNASIDNPCTTDAPPHARRRRSWSGGKSWRRGKPGAWGPLGAWGQVPNFAVAWFWDLTPNSYLPSGSDPDFFRPSPCPMTLNQFSPLIFRAFSGVVTRLIAAKISA